MFEYFPNNYTWSLAVMSALNRGGQISEIDEACRPLQEAAGIKALVGDQNAQRAWFESWMKLAERIERLAARTKRRNTRFRRVASTCAQGFTTCWPSACRHTRTHAVWMPTNVASLSTTKA